MIDIFISYARGDIDFVAELQKAVSTLNISCWMDVKNVFPTALFMQEMYQGIEEASNFLFIISPQSVNSEMCNLEVSHALSNNKRIIPVEYRSVEVKELSPGPIKTLLETVTWLSIANVENAHIDYVRLSKRLIKIVETDLDYMRKHARFLERAKQWISHGENESYLLQGDDLEDAANWLQGIWHKQSPPTELHRRYIQASQTHQLEENNKWEELYRTADTNRRRAEKTLAEFYKEQGRSELLNGNAIQAALYLNEAYKMGLDDAALKFLLARAMVPVDAQIQTLQGHKDLVETAQFSPDGMRVLTSSKDATARIWDMSTGICLTILNGHTAPIRVATYSPDGRYIVTGGEDQRVNIWDAKTYQLHRKLEGHSGKIGLAEFSSDGSMLITANGALSPEEGEPVDTCARVWKVETGELLFTLSDHTEAVSSAQFSPDETTIATGSLDGSVKLWQSQTGRCLLTFSHFEEDDKEKGSLLHLAFSPDRAWLVAGGGHLVTIWDIVAAKVMATIPAHLSNIASLSFSPDGRFMATTSLDKSAIVRNTETFERVSELEGHKASVGSAQFSPDSSSLLTASSDGKAKLWEARSGRLIHSFEGHRADVYDARFNHDGTYVVTASSDGTAKIWSTSNNSFKVFPACDDSLSSAVFSRDGSRIVTSNIDSSHPLAQIWDASTSQCLFSLEGHEDMVEYACFSPDGNYVITTSADKTAKLWSAENGYCLTTLTGHTNTVKFAEFSSDSQFVATASFDGTAKVWSVPTGDLRSTLNNQAQQTSELVSVRFSPDNDMVVAAGSNGKANVWKTVDEEWCFSLEHADSLHALQFSPDGTYILTASADSTAKIWRSKDGMLLQTLQHSSNVFALDVSSDNLKVVTGSVDKSAKVWDIATGSLVCSLDDHEGWVLEVHFSPDNAFIITVDMEGQGAKVWDALTGVLLSRLENPVGMTTFALFSPDGQRALTTQAKVIFNPNVYMIKKTYARSGSTLVAWNLRQEIRDPHQLSMLIRERVPFHLEEGRLLPVVAPGQRSA